jgi:hypothetical protein
MAEIEGINVPAKVVYDPSGLQQAKEDLSKTGDAAKDAGAKAKEGASGFEELTNKLKDLVGAAAVIGFLRESWAEIYENEKALRGVSAAAARYGLDQVALRKKVDETAKSMALFAGVADNEVTRTLSKQLMVTGSLEQATARASAATLLAKEMGWEYARAEQMVEMAAIGRTRSLSLQLGIVAHGTTQDEKAADAIKQLNEMLVKGAVAVKDHALAYDIATQRTKIFQQQLGEQMAPSIVWLKGAFMDATEWIVTLFEKIGAHAVKMASDVAATGHLIKNLFKPGVDASKEFAAELTNNERDLVYTIESIDEKSAADRKKRSAGVTLEEMVNNAKKLAANKNLNAEEKKEQKETHDYTIQQLQSRVGAELDAYKRLQLQLQVINAQRIADEKKVLEEGVDVERKLAQVREIAANNALRAQHKFDEEFSKEIKKLDLGRVELEKQTADKILHIKKALSEDARELLKKEIKAARAKAEAEEAVARGAIAFGNAAFGQNKEMAIAGATIDTYFAAARALKDWPYPYSVIVAALAIATGLAQVAQIVSTSPSSGGGGFDNPANDQAAYWGGRKWARDEVAKFSSGASAGMAGYAAGMGGGSSHTDNRRTYNVHLHGVGLFDPSNQSQMRRLWRGFQSMDRNIEQRVVSGRG